MHENPNKQKVKHTLQYFVRKIGKTVILKNDFMQVQNLAEQKM